MNRTVSLCFALAFVTPLALAPTPVALAQAVDERELQTLVNDTAFQFKLTHRDNATELADHHEQLRAAVAGWNASGRTEADDRRLAEWLRGAIRASMPGSSVDLPPLPKFEPKSKPTVRPARPVERTSPSMPRENPVTQTSAETRFESSSLPSGPALNRAPSATPTNTSEIEAPVEQMLMRPTSSPTMTTDEFDLFSSESDTSDSESAAADTATTEEGMAVEESTAESVEDFWSDHPASGELPDDLSSGDPFIDDPLPAEE